MAITPTKKRGELSIHGTLYKAKIFTVDGREIELYRVGALAAALKKSVQTIEIWELEEGFPKSMFNITGTGLGHCKRWYSKEQILNIVAVHQIFPIGRGRPEMKEAFFRAVKKVFYRAEVISVKRKAAPHRDPAAASGRERPQLESEAAAPAGGAGKASAAPDRPKSAVAG